MKKIILLTIILIGLFTVSASAQTKVRVKIPKGKNSIIHQSKVVGYKYVDYIVRAKAGQTMTVKLTSPNENAEFVIFYSDMKNVEDATGVREFTRNVDVDDDYVVRVLLPRSEARRKGAFAAFSIEFTID